MHRIRVPTKVSARYAELITTSGSLPPLPPVPEPTMIITSMEPLSTGLISLTESHGDHQEMNATVAYPVNPEKQREDLQEINEWVRLVNVWLPFLLPATVFVVLAALLTCLLCRVLSVQRQECCPQGHHRVAQRSTMGNIDERAEQLSKVPAVEGV